MPILRNGAKTKEAAKWGGGLERQRKDRPVSFEMPRIKTPVDSVKAAAAIATAVADGDLTMEAAELAKVLDGYTRAVETAELAEPLTQLEQAQGK